MRALAATLLLLSVLLGAARLFTGVVYGADAPLAYFVLKRAPSAAPERAEIDGPPVETDIVLDMEEPQLFYADLYFGLMHATPGLVAVLLPAGVLLWLADARRRRGGRGRGMR